MRERCRFITVVIGVEDKASLIDALQQHETLTHHPARLNGRDNTAGRVGKAGSRGI